MQADLEKRDCCRVASRQREKHSKTNIQQSCGAARALHGLVITVSFIIWMDGWINTGTTQQQRPLVYLHDIAALNSDDVVVAWVVMSKLTDAMMAGACCTDACCKQRAERSTQHW